MVECHASVDTRSADCPHVAGEVNRDERNSQIEQDAIVPGRNRSR